MSDKKPFEPQGVIPAVLLPFEDDYAIDEPGFRKHLRDVTGVDGLSAITVNGHSSEVHALTFEEQKLCLAVTMDEIGDHTPVIAGVHTDSSLEAARIARMSEDEGASALLVFPPNSMLRGGEMRPEMALAHFRNVADASDLPIILFQFPCIDGLGYPMDTLLSILDAVPTIRAIKDGNNDPMRHERNIRELHALSTPVKVLSTHSMWLMSSLIMGCDGLLSGAGSVIADLQVALWRAVQARDLARAQAINDRIYPLAQAFYAAPSLDMHNRMKEVMVHIGRMQSAVVRPPLVKLTDGEIASLIVAADAAGLTGEGFKDLAA